MTHPVRIWQKMRGNGSESAEIARLRAALDEVELAPGRKRMLMDRYLGYGRWLDRTAQRAQRWHYSLRITALVGGVLLPAIASLDALGNASSLRWVTVAIGVVVGLSVALDGFLNVRERWLHFRLAAEMVQSELWQFATLSGEHFEGEGSHEEAFLVLVDECERFIAREVSEYLKGPAQEAKQDASGTGPAG